MEKVSIHGAVASVMPSRSFVVAGLFAGIGGLELGLGRAGHRTELLCEIDPPAAAVLRHRFPEVELIADVRGLRSLPKQVDLLVAGFPCQDLSQAGRTVGIGGRASGLVGEVFRLLGRRRVPWLVLENVPFMLQLQRGRALERIVVELERLGYRWAYRIVDSRAFGLPQRRRRVFLVAARDDDPRKVLFADEAMPHDPELDWRKVGCGFYWTEGWRGVGWAVGGVPTLKGGSTLGIPSPPAIVLPGGRVIQPDIRDAERLQGFVADWTAPAANVKRPGFRWRLVGNAVTVDVAAWIGARLGDPGDPLGMEMTDLGAGASWPTAAWGEKGRRFAVRISEWPQVTRGPALLEFLRYDGTPLSARATRGFLDRVRSAKATVRCDPDFLAVLERHWERMAAAGGA